jgi:SAM-dependent methyltransferase
MTISTQESVPTIIPDQQGLWDAQHAQRGATQGGLEGDHLVDTPNDAAILFHQLVVPEARIVEVGSANGRDARFWARQGHRIDCLDFSRVALGQLVEHAERQGVSDRINPLYFNANAGKLPEEVDSSIDGFYSRSALHVDDDTLMSLLGDVDDRLSAGGVVLIEGNGTEDAKIARSVDLGNGLAVDPKENGHLRRIWTPESLEQICTTFGWTALQQETVGENWVGTDATFLRLVATK